VIPKKVSSIVSPSGSWRRAGRAATGGGKFRGRKGRPTHCVLMNFRGRRENATWSMTPELSYRGVFGWTRVVEVGVRTASLACAPGSAVRPAPSNRERGSSGRGHHSKPEHLAVEVLGARGRFARRRKWVQLGVTGRARIREGVRGEFCQRRSQLALKQSATHRRQKWARCERTTALGRAQKTLRLPRRAKCKPRGGLIVVQEIFGVNGHIRSCRDG